MIATSNMGQTCTTTIADGSAFKNTPWQITNRWLSGSAVPSTGLCPSRSQTRLIKARYRQKG